MQNLTILGSTGSIGTNCLKIVSARKDQFRVHALAARSNLKVLKQQVEAYKPDLVAVWDPDNAKQFQGMIHGRAKVLSGSEGLRELASSNTADVVVNSLVGAVGLLPTVEALKTNKKIALANKETLVIGGEIINSLLAKGRGSLIPIDSEHSALHQCLNGSSPEQIEKLIITASGGPFLSVDKRDLVSVTTEQALHHPNWRMGKKITIDSATLMNKGLEVIEAHYLFRVDYDDIEVVIHPQSIIHSMVQFTDGSVMAQLGPADMKIPIQYALSYPNKWQLPVQRLDFAKIGTLTFQSPDTDKFTCLRLAYEAGKQAGSLPTVMNAANEVAVELFLAKQISFDKVPVIIEEAMAKHKKLEMPGLEDILAIDREVRDKIRTGELK